MSLSEIIIKIIGIILAFVGVALLLTAIGLTFLFGVGLGAWYWNILVGVIFLGAGIYIIRGGTVNL